MGNASEKFNKNPNINLSQFIKLVSDEEFDPELIQAVSNHLRNKLRPTLIELETTYEDEKHTQSIAAITLWLKQIKAITDKGKSEEKKQYLAKVGTALETEQKFYPDAYFLQNLLINFLSTEQEVSDADIKRDYFDHFITSHLRPIIQDIYGSHVELAHDAYKKLVTNLRGTLSTEELSEFTSQLKSLANSFSSLQQTKELCELREQYKEKLKLKLFSDKLISLSSITKLATKFKRLNKILENCKKLENTNKDEAYEPEARKTLTHLVYEQIAEHLLKNIEVKNDLDFLTYEKIQARTYKLDTFWTAWLQIKQDVLDEQAFKEFERKLNLSYETITTTNDEKKIMNTEKELSEELAKVDLNARLTNLKRSFLTLKLEALRGILPQQTNSLFTQTTTSIILSKFDATHDNANLGAADELEKEIFDFLLTIAKFQDIARFIDKNKHLKGHITYKNILDGFYLLLKQDSITVEEIDKLINQKNQFRDSLLNAFIYSRIDEFSSKSKESSSLEKHTQDFLTTLTKLREITNFVNNNAELAHSDLAELYIQLKTSLTLLLDKKNISTEEIDSLMDTKNLIKEFTAYDEQKSQMTFEWSSITSSQFVASNLEKVNAIANHARILFGMDHPPKEPDVNAEIKMCPVYKSFYIQHNYIQFAQALDKITLPVTNDDLKLENPVYQFIENFRQLKEVSEFLEEISEHIKKTSNGCQGLEKKYNAMLVQTEIDPNELEKLHRNMLTLKAIHLNESRPIPHYPLPMYFKTREQTKDPEVAELDEEVLNLYIRITSLQDKSNYITKPRTKTLKGLFDKLKEMYHDKTSKDDVTKSIAEVSKLCDLVNQLDEMKDTVTKEQTSPTTMSVELNKMRVQKLKNAKVKIEESYGDLLDNGEELAKTEQSNIDKIIQLDLTIRELEKLSNQDSANGRMAACVLDKLKKEKNCYEDPTATADNIQQYKDKFDTMLQLVESEVVIKKEADNILNEAVERINKNGIDTLDKESQKLAKDINSCSGSNYQRNKSEFLVLMLSYNFAKHRGEVQVQLFNSIADKYARCSSNSEKQKVLQEGQQQAQQNHLEHGFFNTSRFFSKVQQIIGKPLSQSRLARSFEQAQTSLSR